MATARTMRLSRVAAAAGGAWLSLLSAAAASAAPSVTDVRLGPYGEGTRLIVELTGAVEFEVFALARPERLVIDLPPVELGSAGADAGLRPRRRGAGTLRPVPARYPRAS